MADLPLAAVKRLASVKGKGFRVGEDAVALIDAAAAAWIRKLAEESFVFAVHAQRSTLKAVDVVPVLEKMGMKVPTVTSPSRPKPATAKSKPVTKTLAKTQKK
jgi:histone H3/H4